MEQSKPRLVTALGRVSIAAAALALACSADAGPPPGAGLRVLFIGNSYTFVNDLPGMLSRIAATAGPPQIAVDQFTIGGALLSDLWAAGAPDKIRAGGWTHVVLQGQSVEAAANFYDELFLSPMSNPGTLVENGDFADHANRFAAVTVDAGATPTWFVTWAREASDANYPFLGAPDEMQDALSSGYAHAARGWPTSILACAGEAFRTSLAQHPELTLHQSDHSHPTVAGTYLAASVLYVALTGQPVPASSEVPQGLGGADAATLRAIANTPIRCADVKTLGHLRLDRVSGVAYTTHYYDGYGWGNFVGGSSQRIAVRNRGDSPAGLRDALSLAPPYRWTSGVYPGFVVSTFEGEPPPCSDVLAGHASCEVSVAYSGASADAGTLTLALTGAYEPELKLPLSASALRDGPNLTMAVAPGAFSFNVPSYPFDESWHFSPLPAEVGVPQPFDLVVRNQGNAAATQIAPYFPVRAPCSWGAAPDADAMYPGGSGRAYCTDTLQPGEACILTANFFTAVETSAQCGFWLGYAADADQRRVVVTLSFATPDAGP